MAGMGKHVEDTCSGEKKTSCMHQDLGVTGQGSWITRDIHKPLNPFEFQALDDLAGSGTGRIQEYLIKVTRDKGGLEVFIRQIHNLKIHVIDLVVLCIPSRPSNQAGLTLYTQDPTRMTSDRQGKIAQTAKEIEHTLVWLGI